MIGLGRDMLGWRARSRAGSPLSCRDEVGSGKDVGIASDVTRDLSYELRGERFSVGIHIQGAIQL